MYLLSELQSLQYSISLQIACVPLNSGQDKTLNKGDIKLLEKKGEEKKYNI